LVSFGQIADVYLAFGEASADQTTESKTPLYQSVVENKRLDSGRVIQRHALSLGEINSSGAEVWRRTIEMFDAEAGRARIRSPYFRHGLVACPG
jgi:hypothetical protein